jgi:predicted nucleic-acid-binding Zn-ribbon protein
MSCKKCASENERSFKAELTAAFKELEDLNHAPVYISQDVLICLECGHTELTFPAKELELLRQTRRDARAQGRSS